MGNGPRVRSIKTRRYFSPADKARILAEFAVWSGTRAEFARRKKLGRSLLDTWIRSAKSRKKGAAK